MFDCEMGVGVIVGWLTCEEGSIACIIGGKVTSHDSLAVGEGSGLGSPLGLVGNLRGEG